MLKSCKLYAHTINVSCVRVIPTILLLHTVYVLRKIPKWRTF